MHIQSSGQEDYKNAYCYGDGKYCAEEKSLYKLGLNVSTPTDTIDEAIRQNCIYELDTSPTKQDWFSYIRGYRDQCLTDFLTKHFKYLSDCSLYLMRRISSAKINYPFEVKKCFESSWLDENGEQITDFKAVHKNTHDNKFLSAYVYKQSEYEFIYVVPSVLINNFMFRGKLEAWNVATSICDAFKDKKDGCVDMRVKANSNMLKVNKDVNYGGEGVDEYIWFIMGGLVFVVVGISVIMMKVFKGYAHKQANKEVNDLIESHVGEYMK